MTMITVTASPKRLQVWEAIEQKLQGNPYFLADNTLAVCDLQKSINSNQYIKCQITPLAERQPGLGFWLPESSRHQTGSSRIGVRFRLPAKWTNYPISAAAWRNYIDRNHGTLVGDL